MGEAAASPPNLRTWAKHAAALLKAAGKGAVVVVGHGAGANAALKLAESSPLAGLVLLGAGHASADRARDEERAAGQRVIQPINYAAIVRNVAPNCTLRLYSKSDDSAVF